MILCPVVVDDDDDGVQLPPPTGLTWETMSDDADNSSPVARIILTHEVAMINKVRMAEDLHESGNSFTGHFMLQLVVGVRKY